MSSQCVGIIGVGNMGEALLAGLLAAGQAASEICFVEKREERANQIASQYGAKVATLEEIGRTCDVILLVVKPQDLATTLDALKPHLQPAVSIVSFVAGKTIAGIETQVEAHTGAHSVIRVMPNSPTLIGKGMAAISPGTHTSLGDMDFVKNFLGASGEVVEVTEGLQDAVTATSGSGPAYFFAFVEAMVEGAKALGLSEEVATQLTVQTLIGAAGMLEQSGKSASTLRENVTSPNGTTAAALALFESCDLTSIVAAAMKAAADRCTELA